MKLVFGFQLFKHILVIFRKFDRRAVDTTFGLDFLDGLGGAIKQFRIFGPLLERLVPDLPFIDDILVAFNARAAIPEPGLEGLRIVRYLFNAHAETEIAPPDGIAVGEAYPRLNPHSGHFAHLPVEPREIVNSLFLLGFRPTGEKTSALRAEHSDEMFVLIPIGIIAVHRLAADRPAGSLDIPGVADLQAADLLKAQIESFQLLTGDAAHLLPFLSRSGVVGIPGFKLCRIFETDDFSFRA